MRRCLLLFFAFCFAYFSQAQITISTEAELRGISNDLGGHYILTNDIVLSQVWNPIGLNAPFHGILDGNGHSISNLRINNSKSETVGFFAKTENAQILNLGFENPRINAKLKSDKINAGVIIGKAISTKISNTYSDGGFLKSNGSAGGLVGSGENVQIENTYFSGLIEAKSTCGGILGISQEGNSVVSSAVISPILKGKIVNRIVGEDRGGKLYLNNNYARSDMKIGYENLISVPFSNSFIKGMQGESIPYEVSDYVSNDPNFTDQDIETATDAFNENYLSDSRQIYYEYSSKRGKVAAIWTQAILFDIMMNQYLRTKSEAEFLQMNQILEGNGKHYADFNWDNGVVWFIYDDIMWWVISLARAYQVNGDAKYLELSKTGFERVWSGSKILKDNGSYDPVNSGMYWAWDQRNPEGTPLPSMGKMACINYPTVIGALTLFEITKDSTYFKKGLEIFNWAQNNLFNKATGRVADSKHGRGNPNWKDHVYNQATCIGAATMLYKATGERKFLDDAVLAANYTKNQMSTNGYLHFENGIEQGIYHAIFAQYIIRLIEDGGQYQYIPWLRYNINAGWANRLKSNNITYKDYANRSPEISKIQSYDASGIPALMQMIKPADSNEPVTNLTNEVFYNKNLNWNPEIWSFSNKDKLPKLKRFENISKMIKRPRERK